MGAGRKQFLGGSMVVSRRFCGGGRLDVSIRPKKRAVLESNRIRDMLLALRGGINGCSLYLNRISY